MPWKHNPVNNISLKQFETDSDPTFARESDLRYNKEISWYVIYHAINIDIEQVNSFHCYSENINNTNKFSWLLKNTFQTIGSCFSVRRVMMKSGSLESTRVA